MKKTSSSRRPTKARRERPDLYQRVTDNIIGAIERGTLPGTTPGELTGTGFIPGRSCRRTARRDTTIAA